MKLLGQVSRFIKLLHRGSWFATSPVKPLDVLRVEVLPSNHTVSCDWLMRPVNMSKPALPEEFAAKRQSEQTLLDALEMRSLIFRVFPDAHAATLRVYKHAENGRHEMVLTGNVSRSDGVASRGSSIAMRAHLYGFYFVLSAGVLLPFPTEDSRSRDKTRLD